MTENEKEAVVKELGWLMTAFAEMSHKADKDRKAECENKHCLSAAMHKDWSDRWMKAAQVVERRMRVIEAREVVE